MESAEATPNSPISFDNTLDIEKPRFFPADSPELKDMFQNHREKVDYSKMWPQDTPVLFIGEGDHDGPRSVREFTSRVLPTLKQLGATHVALEMLNEDQQAALDKYLSGELPRSLMLDELKGWDSWVETSSLKYLDMIDAIHEAGLKIVAIDDQDQEEEHTFSTMTRRNANWRKVITKVFQEDAKARIVVYCGAGHAYYNMEGTANKLLDEVHIKSKVVHFVHGTSKWQGDSEDLHTSIANTAIDDQDDNYRRFALNLQYLGDKKPVDYVVHLPVPTRQV